VIKEIYKKTKKDFITLPNLENYEEYRKSFSWNQIRNEFSWFDGKINAAYNAVDRHVDTWRKNKIALYWEGDDSVTQEFTFFQIHLLSNKIGNILKNHGIERGDRVFLFLPRIPELYFSFLGILKIGAVAGSLFSAFQEQALEDRLANSQAKIVITNSELKLRIDKIRKNLPDLKTIICVDLPDFKKEMEKASDECHISQMDPDDYAFMLYTSGTTGKPKGVVHSHRSIIQQHATTKWVLDLKDSDTYWCTADPGWVTGIAYEILGNWSCGITQVVYSGRFSPEKWYEILQKYQITVWYTAPTAIRMLMASGDKLPRKYNLKNLRHLCSVGEPLNPEAIKWGLRAFDKPFHDTWWQTETGAICISNYPCMDIKIGSMGKPIPGIDADIVDDHGKVQPVNTEGNIALKPKWPSMMKNIWRRPQKYDSYFVNNWYISGDKGMKDKDGYFWFIGRADDVIKTSGERVGPFEVESALVAHAGVIEAGVIGKPDALRGEIIKAFVVVNDKTKALISKKPEALKFKEELAQFVKKHLAGHAYPREIEFIDKLPKTRSGKIMRRILKAKEMGLPIGDTSTLEDY